ncbi:MAG: hypothetical protein A2V66_03535 [Ignavibacteria bacterium RBG_13_36_8]|nr:MAG: hypothetical protein A2V66_03535 [Ignavibacteria bacterium RBG_13_36_8]
MSYRIINNEKREAFREYPITVIPAGSIVELAYWNVSDLLCAVIYGSNTYTVRKNNLIFVGM